VRYPESCKMAVSKILLGIIIPIHLSPLTSPCIKDKDTLLNVECQKWQIEYQRNPVAIDKEQEGQESMNSRFGNNIRIEAIAEVDGINVITVVERTQLAKALVFGNSVSSLKHISYRR